MRDLVKLLREKQREADRLRKELEGTVPKQRRLAQLEAELREAAAVLRGEGLLEKPKSRHGFVGGKRAKPIEEGSSVWLTAKILYLVGQPMHIDRILERIYRETGQKFKKATVVSNLSRYVRYGDTFNRPAPNTFGLIDFAKDIDSKVGIDGSIQ